MAAKAAWDDEPGVYQAVFAPPEKVQAPRKTRAPKAKSKLAPKEPKAGETDTSPR